MQTTTPLPTVVRPALRLHALALALGLAIAPNAWASSFLEGGRELSSALKAYAANQGWKLTWRAGEDYFLEVDQVLPGQSLVDDVEHVVRTYQNRGALNGVDVKVLPKAREIALVRGAMRTPRTDAAISLRASVVGENRLNRPAALALDLPMPTAASNAPVAITPPGAGANTIAPSAAPTPLPALALPPQPTYAIESGDLMSEVLDRWTKGTNYHVVWDAKSDIRLQAGHVYSGRTLIQSIEELANQVASSRPGLRVKVYRNGVVRITEAAE